MNPHEMTVDELCRAVAVEVLGWKKLYTTCHAREEDRNFRWTDGENHHIGEYWQLDWNSAGRVVEAMETDGYLFRVQRMWGLKCWLVFFGYMGRDAGKVDAEASSQEFPRAVFEAALQAKRAQG